MSVMSLGLMRLKAAPGDIGACPVPRGTEDPGPLPPAASAPALPRPLLDACPASRSAALRAFFSTLTASARALMASTSSCSSAVRISGCFDKRPDIGSRQRLHDATKTGRGRLGRTSGTAGNAAEDEDMPPGVGLEELAFASTAGASEAVEEGDARPQSRAPHKS